MAARAETPADTQPADRAPIPGRGRTARPACTGLAGAALLKRSKARQLAAYHATSFAVYVPDHVYPIARSP